MAVDGFQPVAPDSLVDLLLLERVGSGRFLSRRNEENRGGEVFGGQYLGQSLRAALETAPDFLPQAMSCYFLRAARAAAPLEFAVELTRQGRRFAHRRVTVSQASQEVFRAEVALYRPDEGQPTHCQTMPEVSGPDGLASLTELMRRNRALVGEETLARHERNRMSEIRPLETEIALFRAGHEPALRYWVRGCVPAGTTAVEQYAALAYLTDSMANMASRVMHTARGWGKELSYLSLNHAVSFHAPPRVEDWLLFDLSSQFASGGIGSNRNLIFGADGRLVASVTQDAMVRYA